MLPTRSGGGEPAACIYPVFQQLISFLSLTAWDVGCEEEERKRRRDEERGEGEEG